MSKLDPLEAAKRTLIQCFGLAMEKEFLFWKCMGLACEDTKEEYFGFSQEEVAAMHYHKQGHGEGIFFRLRDGRVFDGAAKQHGPDRELYDATTH